jgi:para-nitrobenzyl esterase
VSDGRAGVSDALITTGLGVLRGVRSEDGALGFRGVPYAGSTAGGGRWAPPAPPGGWTGERDARRPGPVCPQPARPFSEWAHGPLPAADEDCLSLNLWCPPGAGPHPVLVFIHGGGWALGWGSNPLLDGSHLARELGAVVITLNYRLGSLGWLWHPELAEGAGAPCGNWGLLDQLAALRWVAEHVAAFGGDPARVTLAGESAGAGSVLHLLAHPETGDLFSRVIAQSPPLHELVIEADQGRRWTEAIVEHLAARARAVAGSGTGVRAGISSLRALPAEAIVAAQEELLADPAFRGTRGGAMPILDPASLPTDPAGAPATRPDIPVLIGTNANEGTFFFRAGGRRLEPDEAGLEEIVAHVAGGGGDTPRRLIERERERAQAAGLTPDANDLLCAIVTEAWFAGPVKRWSAARAAAGASVHRYRVDHPAAEDNLGATHSIDVPLLFASWREGGVAARLAGTGAAAEAVSAAIGTDWRHFVHGQQMDWVAMSGEAGAPPVLAVYGGPGGAREILDGAQTGARSSAAA